MEIKHWLFIVLERKIRPEEVRPLITNLEKINCEIFYEKEGYGFLGDIDENNFIEQKNMDFDNKEKKKEYSINFIKQAINNKYRDVSFLISIPLSSEYIKTQVLCLMIGHSQ